MNGSIRKLDNSIIQFLQKAEIPAARIAIFFIALHLLTIVLPLVFLPGMTWGGFLTPTLESQYIIKNVLIAALAIVIGAKVKPAL